MHLHSGIPRSHCVISTELLDRKDPEVKRLGGRATRPYTIPIVSLVRSNFPLVTPAFCVPVATDRPFVSNIGQDSTASGNHATRAPVAAAFLLFVCSTARERSTSTARFTGRLCPRTNMLAQDTHCVTLDSLRLFAGASRPIGVDGFHGGWLREFLHLSRLGLHAEQRHVLLRRDERNCKYIKECRAPVGRAASLLSKQTCFEGLA